MSTLRFERNLARFAAARVASAFGSGRGAGIGPLRLVEQEAPPLPDAGWVGVTPTLSGICGSDLATVDGRSSRYFEELTSFPFVPGHEIVGVTTGPARTADGQLLAPGDRVLVEPVLGCVARGIVPPCTGCASGATERCERTAHGHLRPGLQTGFCADTGGGWSSSGLVAHHSQLHPVPDDMDDRDAVTVEPAACALHAALAAGLAGGEQVAVVGAGSVGLLVTAALHYLQERGAYGALGSITVGARYGHQRAWAEDLGATAALPPDQLARAVRRASGSLALGSPSAGALRLTGGADVVLDCVGSAASLEAALELVRPGGRVVLVGMPSRVQLDLAALWHREVSLVGAYAYGQELVPTHQSERERANGSGDGVHPVRTFALAMDLAATRHTGRLVSATYPLERFEEALAHAGAAGRRRAVKIAFTVQAETRRSAARRSARRRSTHEEESGT